MSGRVEGAPRIFVRDGASSLQLHQGGPATGHAEEHAMHDEPQDQDERALDNLIEALSAWARESREPVAAQAAMALAAFRHRASERDPGTLGLAVTMIERPKIWAALGAQLDA